MTEEDKENKKEDKTLDWVKIIMSIIISFFSIFGFAFYQKLQEEQKRRVEANNEVARMSEVLTERENAWSRLSEQKENLISILEDRNSELASLIREREGEILSLTETVANFQPTRIVVRRDRVTQIENPETPGRTRVDFTDEVDPIRVSGFTLTNPPEAEVDVAFTRPLRLRTTITQERSGVWRTYTEGDWPNLEIQNIETSVNPMPARSRRFIENIIVGGSLAIGVAPEVDSVNANIHILYDINNFVIGPQIGFDFVNDEARFTVGIQTQFYPWRQ